MTCETCRLIKNRDDQNVEPWDNIVRTENFDIVHSFNTSLLGWIVIVARRHIDALDKLTEEEAMELGLLIRKVSLGLKATLQCSKTYAMQFAEQPGHSHVHFHIVPRMGDIPPENMGAGIFNYLGVTEESRVTEATMNQFAIEFRSQIAIT